LYFGDFVQSLTGQHIVAADVVYVEEATDYLIHRTGVMEYVGWLRESRRS
jgi:hypothetical protein